MQDGDTGFFTYNIDAPLGFSDESNRFTHVNKKQLDPLIINFLKNCHATGISHHKSIAVDGFTAEEIAIHYLRRLNEKRKRNDNNNIDAYQVLDVIKISMLQYMDIDVNDNDLKHSFDKYINVTLFSNKQYKRSLMPSIKAFLEANNKKFKRYTIPLKQVMTAIDTYIKSCN